MSCAQAYSALTIVRAVYVEPLDRVLSHDGKRLICLLEYVRYPYNPLVQQEAIKLAQHLVERMPSIVSQFLLPYLSGEKTPPPLTYLSCKLDVLLVIGV